MKSYFLLKTMSSDLSSFILINMWNINASQLLYLFKLIKPIQSTMFAQEWMSEHLQKYSKPILQLKILKLKLFKAHQPEYLIICWNTQVHEAKCCT